MGRQVRFSTYLMLLGAAMIVAAGVGWYLSKRSSSWPQTSAVGPGPAATASARQAAHLYFGDLQGRYLMAEQRVLDRPGDDIAFGRQLVDALIQGSEQAARRTLPSNAKVRALYMAGDGVAYVDFDSAAFADHPGGVGAELLSIYSIVNTLVLNVEAIRSVKLLIGGQEAATLAGHVDLRHPFAADMLWVR